MTLMELRLNLLQDDIAERFRVSQSVVSRIISQWMDFMEDKMRCYVPWLTRETIQATMPQSFKENDPLTTCLIDCSETPSSEGSQSGLKSRDLQSLLWT